MRRGPDSFIYNTYVVILLILSLSLINNYNNFQPTILGNIFDNITHYLKFNNFFSKSTSELKIENELLKKKIESLITENHTLLNKVNKENVQNFSNIEMYIGADVVQLTYNLKNNFIFINKGKKDGLYKWMGVYSENGIVGYIFDTYDDYSLVIPIINSDFVIGIEIKNTNYKGTLIWDGENPHEATINNIPKESILKIGDTIVSSSYSKIFTKDIFIGTVSSIPKIDERGGLINTKIKLGTNFLKLNYVLISPVIEKKYLPKNSKEVL